MVYEAIKKAITVRGTIKANIFLAFLVFLCIINYTPNIKTLYTLTVVNVSYNTNRDNT
jgi:hypothetical protein